MAALGGNQIKSSTNRDGIEEKNDEKPEQRDGPDQVAGVDGGQQEQHGGADEEDAGDDGFVDPLGVAGAERDELAERGVAGRGHAEHLGVAEVGRRPLNSEMAQMSDRVIFLISGFERKAIAATVKGEVMVFGTRSHGLESR